MVFALSTLILCVYQVFPPDVFSQSASATLSGVVIDQNGAIVPDAKVTLTNRGTRSERRTRTNGEGLYVFTQLTPGNYDLKVERSGFSTAEANDLSLQVDDQRSLRIALKVAGVGDTVIITSDAVGIKESTSVGTVIDRNFAENMPLNGRSFQSLIQLTPGVIPTAGDPARQGQFSVNGQRESSNYFTVDGVSANLGISASSNPFGGGGQYPAYNAQGATNSLVAVEALQEFKIQTSTFAPEFGRTPGGQVSIATRSGTNEFHGTLFEYFRNEALDANDYFANRSQLPKAALRQNMFGGVFGGPVILPRFGEGGPPLYNGRNRLFFFFSYEGLRLRIPKTSLTAVPSLTARRNATGAAQSLFNSFPVPNGNELGNGLAELIASYSNPSNADATSIRIDYVIGDRLTFFGRYNRAPSRSDERGQFGNNTAVITSLSNNIDTLTAGATLIFTPLISNDVRFNYSRNNGRNASQGDDFGGAAPMARSLLFPGFVPSGKGDISIFLTDAFDPFTGIGERSGNAQEQFNLVNTFSIVSGRRQIKLGVDYRRTLPKLDFTPYSQSVFFDSIQQAIAGQNSGISISAFAGPIFPRYHNLSIFAQDAWKITRRLTLTYGLRYEINPPPTEKNGNGARVVSGLDNIATATLAAPGTPLFKTTHNNFAPRFGMSYQMRQSSGFETVVRGGVGVFYDLLTGQIATAYDPFRFPYASDTFLVDVPFPAPESLAVPPPPDQNPPFRSVVAFDPELKLPYSLHFNFAVEQSLGPRQIVSATYVGALGRRLYYTESFINPNATFRDLDVVRNASSSDYHALQVQYQRRLSAGLQALASYTWSHSIDTGSNELLIGNLPIAQSSVEQNRGPSDFDRRHSFSAAATYNFPKPQLGAFGAALLGGFSADLIYKALSAGPVDLFRRLSRPGSISQIRIRPDVAPGQPFYLSDPNEPEGRRINPAAFVDPPSGRQGTLGRNSLRGFALSQLDFAVRRQFKLTERTGLQFRAEFFNAFNHPNFADPGGNRAAGTFGRSTQMLGRSLGGLNALYQIGGPRSVQFALRLQF
jgi:hypothetical protein